VTGVNNETTRPIDVVTAFMAAMESLDYDTAMTFVADDCEYTNPVPVGTVYGPDGIRGILEPFFAPTLNNEWVIKRTAESGPVVFMERVDRHQLANGWAELPVTGVFEVRDGRITAWRDYLDFATIERGFTENS
jgi:limonene-1,2-epoxide hydrolase